VPLTFENPNWLWLIALGVPLALAGWWWFTSMSRSRRISAVVLRAFLFALITVMLAGASMVRTSDRLAVIILVDVSDSVRRFADSVTDPQTGRSITTSERISRWIKQSSADRGPDDLVAVIAFDGASAAVLTPTSGEIDTIELGLRLAEGTDIQRAIELAEALVPPGAARRFVLISDGNETSGDARQAARELLARASGTPTPIDVVPIAYRVTGEIMIEAVDIPPQASAGATVSVRVVLVSTSAASGTLELLYEGDALDLNGPLRGTGRHVTLEPGRNVIVLPIELDDRTIHRFEPVFTPSAQSSDTIRENNRAETFTVTPGDGAVLIVQGSAAPSGSSAALAGVLERAGVNIRLAKPGDIEPDLLALQPYGLIVLNNVPAEDFPRSLHGLLADYVTDLGGGLVMVGGEDSFGAGGWHGTDLEPVLPVRLDLPEQIIRPSAAVLIVLDNSGSMAARVAGSFRTQQEIANEGAALAVETLDRTDLVGVITFNFDHVSVVPLARNADAKQSAERVRGIVSGGGTNIYPAMRAALAQLSAVEADVKHVILLSDGRSQGEPDTGVQIAERMSELGISCSTIAVGDGADHETLARIARAGRGQFYNVVNPSVLPRIFLREVRVVRKPLIRTGRFVPVRAASGSVLDTALAAGVPPLYGLVLTQPLDDPKVSNVLMTTEGEPVLSSWYIGRGQAVAFTSDASNWARDWIAWPGFETLWTTIVRTVARPATENTSELITQIVGSELLITYEALTREGEPMGAITVSGTVYAPDGSRREIRLRQSGPGVYTARVPARDKGNYVVALSPTEGTERLAPVIGGTSRAAGPEFVALSSNIQRLRSIAEITGGRTLSLDQPLDANLFDREGVEPGVAHLPLWETLLVWTLAVFLLDVGTRRIAWDRLLNRELMADIRRSAREETARRSAGAVQTVGSLRQSSRSKRESRRTKNGPDALEPIPKRTRIEREPRASAPEPTPSTDENDIAKTPDRTSSLLEAKKRALKRFENDKDDNAGGPSR